VASAPCVRCHKSALLGVAGSLLGRERIEAMFFSALEAKRNIKKHLCLAFVSKCCLLCPRCSMYGIFAYIWVIFGVNAGKCSIHGAYGCVLPLQRNRRILAG
jgi:hypothetical protein